MAPRRADSTLSLQFLGGAGTVTGSKFLLRAGPKRVLIDCGMFQGYKHLRRRNWDRLPVEPKEIDAVLLTHAHIDHTGYLPLLVKDGFRGPIFATSGTRDLCGVLLPDCGFLQEEEARFANKERFSKHKPALPLFTRRDGEVAARRITAVPWGDSFQPVEGVEVRFEPAGHILGASVLYVSSGGKSILFSGDLGRPHDALMRPPTPRTPTDYLVLESTYGGRRHPTHDVRRFLADLVARVVARRGVVVIPSFTVGRAQTLLHHFAELRASRSIPDVPIFLNSPMAIAANGVYRAHAQELRLKAKEMDRLLAVAEYVESTEASKALNKRRGPMVIIAGNGMATGGRVLHHLKRFLPNPRNAVVLVGHQVHGTRGALLRDRAATVKIHGHQISVKAEVVAIEALSAHADDRDLVAWLRSSGGAPSRTFLVHGEPDALESLRRRIQDNLGWAVEVPEHLASLDL